MLDGVPAEERFKILAGNMIRIYDLPHQATEAAA